MKIKLSVMDSAVRMIKYGILILRANSKYKFSSSLMHLLTSAMLGNIQYVILSISKAFQRLSFLITTQALLSAQ